jgi:hypothetical protein
VDVEFTQGAFQLKRGIIDEVRGAFSTLLTFRIVNYARSSLFYRKLNLNKTIEIGLSTQHGYEMVYIKDIMYCTADGSYTHFHFVSGEKSIVSKNLKYNENLLKGYSFIRGHNTAQVNLRFVKRIDRTGGGSIIMEDDKALPIASGHCLLCKLSGSKGRFRERSKLPKPTISMLEGVFAWAQAQYRSEGTKYEGERSEIEVKVASEGQAE